MKRNASRMLRIVLLALCSACLLVVVGCGQSQTTSNETNKQEDSVVTKEVTVEFDDGWLSYEGKNLEVRLEENVTTGYEWTTALEGTGLQADKDEHIASADVTASSEQAMGAGGAHQYTYQGVSAGDSTITFKYARSWEETPDDKTLTVAVVTKEDGTIEKATVQE